MDWGGGSGGYSNASRLWSLWPFNSSLINCSSSNQKNKKSRQQRKKKKYQKRHETIHRNEREISSEISKKRRVCLLFRQLCAIDSGWVSNWHCTWFYLSLLFPNERLMRQRLATVDWFMSKSKAHAQDQHLDLPTASQSVASDWIAASGRSTSPFPSEPNANSNARTECHQQHSGRIFHDKSAMEMSNVLSSTQRPDSLG